MKHLLLANHVLIAAFGVASGAFKVMGGEADVRIFASLGMNATLVAIFGGVQLLSALVTIPAQTRRAGALALATCNAVATAGLFAAGQVPFGIVSILFIVMALLVARSPRGSTSAGRYPVDAST